MYENLIARLATHFADLRTGKREAGIGVALEFVCEELGAGASEIYLYSNGTRGFARTPDWSAVPRNESAGPNIEQPRVEGQSIEESNRDLLDRVTARLVECEIVRVRHASEPEARAPGSVVFVPLLTHGAMVAALMLDWRELDREPSSNEIFKSLRVVGDILTGAIEQLRAEESLRRTEERLRDTQRLEALGRLSGGVAHDFNNFLTAIIGNCELLSDELPDVAECSDEVEEIRRAAQRASTLVDRILTFGRRGRSEARVVDVNWIVADLERLIRRIVGDEIHVVVDLREGCEVVCADPAQIEQVLMNLAVNARDAMPAGGTLSVRVGSREIPSRAGRQLAPGRYVEITVRDDGCGMNEETRSRLFEPFYTTKAHGKGTGLGLATVATIVSELDGEIRVESKVDHGTTFTVLIPKASEVAAVVEVDRPQPPAVRPGVETILVVEEEQVVRDLLRRMLEHDGYKVLEARDQIAALEISGSYAGAIDGVVADLALPHLQGLAMVEELQVLRPRLAAVFTSCYSVADLRDDGVLEESMVCVEKPFGPHKLVQGVQRALDARPSATSEGVISSGVRAPRSPHAPHVTPAPPPRTQSRTTRQGVVAAVLAADTDTLGI